MFTNSYGTTQKVTLFEFWNLYPQLGQASIPIHYLIWVKSVIDAMSIV